MPIEMSELRELVCASYYNYNPSPSYVCEVSRNDGTRSTDFYCGRRAPWVIRNEFVSTLGLFDRGQYICDECLDELPSFPTTTPGSGGRRMNIEREEKRITRRLPK